MMEFYRLAVLTGALVCLCDCMHVKVPEKKQYVMLFQSVVLPCHYQTSSAQVPVVQWWYKSYCRDRTGDSFDMAQRLLGSHASKPADKSHLDCSDSGRTVRVVASAQGTTVTLAEHYDNRNIAIINKADLRIGQVQWGDSGVYFCKVIVSDDLVGTDEAYLELLVLEWAFVGCVAVGGVLFLLLMGICWCQCCPHTCCCYLRCCCCPETCCCPRHLYEAGKKVTKAPPAQMQMYPYFIPGVPAVLPLAPSSRTEPKLTSLASIPSVATFPSVENNLAGACSAYRPKASRDRRGSVKVLYRIKKELPQVPSAKMAAPQPSSLSEVSSLHDGGNADFRHTYHTVQMKALAPIADADDQSSALRAAPRAQARRHGREGDNHSDHELDRRSNTRSEHFLSRRGRAASLEEFARSLDSRSRRAEPLNVHDGSPPPRRRSRDEDAGWDGASPAPLRQKRRRGTWDGELACRPPAYGEYDGGFLARAMERKARGGRGGARPDEDSDTPSKGSSRGKGGNSCYSRSPSNRPEEDDPLPPYSECEAERDRRYRARESVRTEQFDASEPDSSSFSYARPQRAMTVPSQDKDRRCNLSATLSRNTLQV
ncbi:immunoglobulin-like domain-containing receptor 2 isoform X2 [Festucalex cinctus]